MKIGFDPERKCFVFPIYNEHSELINIFYHKGAYHDPKLVKGAPTKMIYPMNLLVDFDKKELLIYGEGLKDVLTLLSKGYNAVTNTNGVLSIPNDLSSFEDVKDILIIYDNDKPGKDGQEKLAERLKRLQPDNKVRLIQWDKSYPDGFDVTDYVNQGGELSELIDDAQEYQLEKGGYDVKTVSEFVEAGFVNPDPIVRELLQTEGIASIAGTDGVGKSFYALQFAMHCSLGIDFLGYEILRPWKVLLINYELSNGQMHERLSNMRDHFVFNHKPDEKLMFYFS